MPALTQEQAEELFPVLKIREPPPELQTLLEKCKFYDQWYEELSKTPLTPTLKPFLQDRISFVRRKIRIIFQEHAQLRAAEELQEQKARELQLEEVLMTPLPEDPEDMHELLLKMREVANQIREGPPDLAQRLMVRVMERRVDLIAAAFSSEYKN
jgi:hypothetical protein